MISLAQREVAQQENRECMLTAQSTRGWGGSMSELRDPPVIHGTAHRRASNDVGFPSHCALRNFPLQRKSVAL
jgi:hypothetical protein